MNFPNLNFEIQYFQDFLNSESKLGWLRQSFFDGNQNAELQLSILALFVVIGVVLVHMFTNYGDLPKAKYRKIQIIKKNYKMHSIKHWSYLEITAKKN